MALLLYAYAQGVFSSRKIAKACIERMDFAAVTGFQKPDFRTISLFRKRHPEAADGRGKPHQGPEIVPFAPAAPIVRLDTAFETSHLREAEVGSLQKRMAARKIEAELT